MKRRLKVNGLLIVLAFAILVLFPAVFLRRAKDPSLDAVAQISGIVFILMGQLLRTSARGYKSEYSRNGHMLIQGGPYSLSRNPMYLGILCVGLGVVLVLFDWWIVAVFLAIFIWRYIFLIFKEEKKLLVMFPGTYQAYIKKVPRLFPSLSEMLQREVYEYLPLKMEWLKREIGSILFSLLIVLFLRGWRDIRREGIMAYAQEAELFIGVIILFLFLAAYLVKRTNNHKKDASINRKDTL